MEEKLFTLKDRDELISTLYYYVRTTQCTSRKIEHDIWVIKITNPRCKKLIIRNTNLMRLKTLMKEMNSGLTSEKL